MFAVTRSHAVWAGSLALAAVLGVTACIEDESTGPTVTGIVLASGGGPAPKVDDTDPPGAPQDTTLDVLVLGSGFDNGSKATFTLDGSYSGSVQTNSTTFVSGNELVANITIDIEALTDLYDVEVMTTRGKKGIGVDLFRVVEKGRTVDTTPVTAEFQDIEGGVVLEDSGGVYDDAQFNDDGSLWVDARGQDTDRRICFDFPDDVGPPDGCYFGYLTTGSGDTEDIYRMARNGFTRTRGQLYWVAAVQDGRKVTEYGWFLRFGQTCALMEEPEDDKQLSVTRSLDDVWTIQGQDASLCRWPTKGKPVLETVADTIAAPFELTVRLAPQQQ